MDSPRDHTTREDVLFLAHRIPFPPDKGDKIRSYREWKALTKHARVTIACFIDDPADEPHVEALAKEVDELIVVRLHPRRSKLKSLMALPSSRSLSLAYYDSKEMRNKLAACAQRKTFHSVLAFSSTMAPYALQVPASKRVLDICDLDSEKWAQFAEVSRFPMSRVYKTEAARLGRYEVECAKNFDVSLLVSQAEADTLLARAPGNDIRVIPNGIDLEYYDPAACPKVRPDGVSTVFCGAMDYKSNVDAVVWYHDEIFPLIQARRPDARFVIVGSKPAPEVQALAATDGVEVTGRVPDVRPHVLGATVSVAPLRLGRGVPNKILEALSLSLPVVVTSNGAAGLDLAQFAACDVADEPQAFADAVLARLAMGSGRIPQHREALQRLYRWEILAEKVREIMIDVPVGAKTA